MFSRDIERENWAEIGQVLCYFAAVNIVLLLAPIGFPHTEPMTTPFEKVLMF